MDTLRPLDDLFLAARGEADLTAIDATIRALDLSLTPSADDADCNMLTTISARCIQRG